MLLVKVLGGGCRNCDVTQRMIEEVAAENDIKIYIDKVTDMQEIMAYGVMSTPAVVIDEKVVHKGGVPDKGSILGWLQ